MSELNKPENYRTTLELQKMLDNPDQAHLSLFKGNVSRKNSKGLRVSEAKPFYSRGDFNKHNSRINKRRTSYLRRSDKRREIVKIVNRKSISKNKMKQELDKLKPLVVAAKQEHTDAYKQNWYNNLFGPEPDPLAEPGPEPGPLAEPGPKAGPLAEPGPKAGPLAEPGPKAGPLAKARQDARQEAFLTKLLGPKFKVITNDGGGNCFFLTLSQALQYQNNKTKYDQQGLRKLVADNTTTQMFYEYDVQQWQLFISKDPRGVAYIRQVYGENYDKNIVNQIKQELSKALNIHDNNKIEKLTISLHKPNLLPNFKEYIKSASYWADTFAITLLRNLLKIQFIIIDSNAKNINCILNTASQNNKVSYDGYILIWWISPAHYELIIYNDLNPTGYFTFKTIPQEVKVVLNNEATTNPLCNNDVKFPIPVPVAFGKSKKGKMGKISKNSKKVKI